MKEESKLMKGERKRFERMQKLQLLPNKYKKPGAWLAVFALTALFVAKFSGFELGDPKFILRSLLICGLLLVAISRDKIEDELTLKLRSQAFVMSFVFGVIYTIFRPFMDYVIYSVFQKDFDPNGFSSFELILVMLMIQILFFYVSKKLR